MKWNYRIGTQLTRVFDKDVRVFSIFECCYDENGIPKNYISPDRNTLSYWESMNDLKETYNLIKSAFDKDIIDLDNFPQIYKKEMNDYLDFFKNVKYFYYNDYDESSVCANTYIVEVLNVHNDCSLTVKGLIIYEDGVLVIDDNIDYYMSLNYRTKILYKQDIKLDKVKPLTKEEFDKMIIEFSNNINNITDIRNES